MDVGLRAVSPAAERLGQERLCRELDRRHGEKRHQQVVEALAPERGGTGDGEPYEGHDRVGKLVGHHARQRLTRQVLHQGDDDGGCDQQPHHQPPGRRNSVFVGDGDVEGQHAGEQDRKGHHHDRNGVGEGGDAEFDGEIGHAQQIAVGHPARRDAADVIDRDRQEGRGQEAGDRHVDRKDECCAAHRVVRFAAKKTIDERTSR